MIDLQKVIAMAPDQFMHYLGMIVNDNFPFREDKPPELAKPLLANLKALWFNYCGQYFETKYGLGEFAYKFVLKNYSENDFKEEEAEFTAWIHHQSVHYCEHTKIFRMKLVSPNKRNKHWPKSGVAQAKVLALTKEGGKKRGSMFYSELHFNVISEWIWLIMSHHFSEFFDEESTQFYFKATRNIGGVNGKPTPYVRFDIDYSSTEFHCYPVNECEIGDHVVTDMESLGFGIIDKT